MNASRSVARTALLSAGLLLLTACQSGRLGPASADVPAELTRPDFLFEVVRYLYRWQLDESEIERLVGAEQCVFWVRRLTPALDPGDRSALAEIQVPCIGLSLTLKKADYRVDELNASVTSKCFRIFQVSRDTPPARPPSDARVVSADVTDMRDYLFRTRAMLDQASPELIERLQRAVRAEAARLNLLDAHANAADKVVHVAPLSPVANEVWAFWEGGRMLFSFSSDIDLSDPAVWEHEILSARIYNLDEQVIVSHEEAPGSNRFLTRSEVGRALFNCLLFGQRLTLSPPSEKP